MLKNHASEYFKADALSKPVIGAAIEVHREMCPGLSASIYEKCLMLALEMQVILAKYQMIVPVKYKGPTFDEPLRLDMLLDACLLLELKSVENVLPIHKAQLLSYTKLLNVPLGLLLNFHELRLRNGSHRMILPGANQ